MKVGDDHRDSMASTAQYNRSPHYGFREMGKKPLSIRLFIVSRLNLLIGEGGSSVKADSEPAVCVGRQCDGYLPYRC